MKNLILLLSMVVSTSVFANSAQDQAEREFKRMSAAEALSSREFTQDPGSIFIPGSSTSVAGVNLCVEGGMIKSTHAISGACTAWQYRNDNGRNVTTSDFRLALAKDADCVSRASAYLSHPISYSAEITVWGAKNSDGNLVIAPNYASANNMGNPVPVGTKTVNKTVRTKYDVKFYRTVSGNRFNDDHYLGKHTVSVANCR